MKVLITGGATWVKIDSVRILTNRFTGKTGLYLAKSLAAGGHKVTFLVNPSCLSLDAEKISGYPDLDIIHFYFFKQLKTALEKQLKNNDYDAVIHTAAVSDYLPKKSQIGKIVSGKKRLKLTFEPAPKLIKLIRKLAKETLLIQFKLEDSRDNLIEAACASLKLNDSDYVVANALRDLSPGYLAYLIDSKKNVIELNSKLELAEKLSSIIEKI